MARKKKTFYQELLEDQKNMNETVKPILDVVTDTPTEKSEDVAVKEVKKMLGSEIQPKSRNNLGLYPDVEYILKDDGGINWRAMVKKEYLIPNKDKLSTFELEKINKGEVDITQLQDDKVLILLSGLKELAKLRGYDGVFYHVWSADDSFVSVSCKINWIPNYESGYLVGGEYCGIVFESLADASRKNCDLIGGKSYLTSVAENRAFSRCVRNFLGIHIVCKDEIGERLVEEDSANISDPYSFLKSTIAKHNLTFEAFKNLMMKNGYEGAEDWNSPQSIDRTRVYEIISFVNDEMKKKLEEKLK